MASVGGHTKGKALLDGGCPSPMSFPQGANSECVPGDRASAAFASKMSKIGQMFCTNPGCMTNDGDNQTEMGYIDLTIPIAAGGTSPNYGDNGTSLTKTLQLLQENGQDKTVWTINGGDEIDLTTHVPTTNKQFQAYLRHHGITLADVGCAQMAGCNMSVGTAANASVSIQASTRFYHTHKFVHDNAIAVWAKKTRQILAVMTHAHVGPNFAPTPMFTATQDGATMYGGALSYIGRSFQMVRGFREKAITLP
jgi:hypothetical protein